MRPVQPSLLGHLAVQHRPDEPMQPQVSDLLRQRERGRIRVRADVRADRVRVRGASGPAPDPRRGDSVRRRRADDLPAIPGDREGGQGHGLPPGPGRDERHPARDRGRLPRQGRRGRAEHDLPAVRRSPRGELHQGPRPAAARHQTQGYRAGPGAEGQEPPDPDDLLRADDVNSFNDDQAGEILNYAIKNRDVVKGVNFQPVSLTGRIPEEDRRKLRYTLSDLAYDLEEQTGYLTRDDWYPVPFVSPISELVSVLTDTAKPSFTSHPACGLASYLFLESGKDPVPITRFIDVEGLMEDLWLLAQDTKDKKIKFTSKLKALQLLKRHFKPEEAPEGMGLAKMLKILNRMFTKGDKAGAAEFSWSTMYVGGMHFQDNYNYDIERVKRCVIHYATPDGKVIPFCAYNTGPNFREEIEKKFAVPIEEWRGRHA